MKSIKAPKRKFGFSELIVAMSPILIQYPNYIGLIALLLIGIPCFFKKVYWYKPLLFYLAFFLLHEIIIGIITPTIPVFFINKTLVTTIMILLVFIIAPNLDYEKFYNSLLLVAIICLMGLLYHVFLIITNSGTVSVIQLPFLPELKRSEEILNRPCSFFVEPSSYASYITFVLFFCLLKRKMLLAIVFTISVLLSTSTNGFAFVFLIWLVYLLLGIRFEKKRNYRPILWFLILIGVFYWLSLNGLFDSGFDKIVETDTSDDVRLTSGVNLYRNIPFEYKILGINTVNVYEFVLQHGEVLTGGYKILVKEGEVYLTSFWEQLIRFGIPGLILYLLCFLWFFREKKLWPYIIVCLVSLFSQSGDLFFKMVCLIVLYLHFCNDKSVSMEKM